MSLSPYAKKNLDAGYARAMDAKRSIFKAQDEVNYVDGLEDAEKALAAIRSELEAFDRLCKRLVREASGE